MTKRDRKLVKRIRRIQSDPSNAKIKRVDRAGQIVDDHLVMHNGLQVKPMDAVYMELLQSNGGCHEPQEELVFQEVLKHIRRGGCMIELGAYWGFYSMWFAQEVDDARCYLVEPEAAHLEVGKYNFAHNGLRGNFFHSQVGRGHLEVDRFVDQQGIDFVDVLHADIQGAEYEMLCDADCSLRDGKIGYIFVGTHSQDLHYRCKQHLEQRDYVVIGDADFDHGTYCADGVLVARHRALQEVDPIELARREPHQPYHLRQRPAWIGGWANDVVRSIFRPRKSA